MKQSASRAALFALLAPVAAMADGEEQHWTDRIELSGDLRLRYEGIDEEGADNRGRGRFRLRFGASSLVNDDLEVVLRFASGGDNPTSRNQTFDDGFSSKDIGLELAYADWSPLQGLHLIGGKMKNPLYRAGSAPLIWDGDLNPEGIAMSYSKGMLFGTLANFSVEERSSSDDSLLQAVQVGTRFEFGGDSKLTVGAGYFAYSNTTGNEPFYDGDPLGNSVDIDGNYVYDYKDTEAFAQFDSQIAGWPWSVYGQWVQNREVDEENTAYAIGARFGSAREKGEMEFSWTYMDIEADAVIGTFNDSDFGGGGTDHSGHMIKGKYVLSKNVAFAASYFSNEVDRFQGTAHDYNRIQLDLELDFE
jgi:Putative porin